MKSMLSSVTIASSVSLVNTVFQSVSSFANQTASTNETTFKADCPCPFTISRMYVKLSAAPGNGGSFTVRVRRRGADTSMVAVVTDPATSADTAGTLATSFQVGDDIDISITPSVGPAPTTAPTVTVVLEVTSTECFPVFGGSTANASTSVDNFATIRGGTAGWETVSARADVPVPIGGYIRNLQVGLAASPGTGKSYDYTLLKNDVDTLLTCNIAGAAVFGSSNQPIRVEAGDLLCTRVRPNGTPAARAAWISYEFLPDVNGQSWTGLGSSANPSTTTAFYNALNAANSAWGATESSKQIPVFAGYTGIGMYAKVGGATPPGTGRSWTLSERRNGVTRFSAIIADLAQTANITGQADVFSDLDLVNYLCTPAGTPAIDASAGMHLSVALQGPTSGVGPPTAKGLLLA